MSERFEIDEVVGLRCLCIKPPYCISGTGIILGPLEPAPSVLMGLIYAGGHRCKIIPAHRTLGGEDWVPLEFIHKLPPLPPEEEKQQQAQKPPAVPA